MRDYILEFIAKTEDLEILELLYLIITDSLPDQASK